MNEQTSKPGDIYRLIPLVMRDVGAIGKDRKNQQQGYAFRGIDDVYNAMQGPLSRHGVFFVPEVLERHVTERPTKSGGGVLFYTTLKVRFTLYAPDGSYVQAVTIGEAMDSADKSSNKAQSAALKYALLEIFCVPTQGQPDADYDSPEPAAAISPEEAFRIQLREAFETRGLDKAAMKEAAARLASRFGAPSIADLTPVQRREALADVDQFIAAAV